MVEYWNLGCRTETYRTEPNETKNLAKGPMNQNVKCRLSEIHGAHTSYLHIHEEQCGKNCAEGKTIWCGLILYGFWCWCQIRCSELFITLCWYILLEKGVYCYCYSTNNFWFGCVGRMLAMFGSNLIRSRKKFQTDCQSYFLHFGSSHCMFLTKLQSFLLIDLNIEHTIDVPLDVALKINLPQAIFRCSYFFLVFGFFFFILRGMHERYRISSWIDICASTSMWMWLGQLNGLCNNL